MADITITLDKKDCEKFADHFRKFPSEGITTNIINQIDAQLRSSQYSLRLKVMRCEWGPTLSGEKYVCIDKKTGEFFPNARGENTWYNNVGGGFIADRKEKFYLAPPELAETLSQVIKGEYRPTQEDDAIRFHILDRYGDSMGSVEWRNTFVPRENLLYFFTPEQRDNFIKQQEAKPLSGKEVKVIFDGREYTATIK